MKENDSIIEYNLQIDGLRCFAVLGVVIAHLKHFDSDFLNQLPFGYGVNIFFVISGYLITKILLINKEMLSSKQTSIGNALKVFYYRRALRIFPIYYLFIFFLMLIHFQNVYDIWGWLVTYTVNFYISNNANPYIGSFLPLWSLSVEEQFYLVWPFFIFIIPKKYIHSFIVATILASVLFKAGYFCLVGYTTGLNAWTISCADALGLGALIAYWSLYKKSWTWISSGYLLNALVLLSLAFFFWYVYLTKVYSDLGPGTNFVFSIFAFFVVLTASQRKFKGILGILLENELVVHLGKISYGIYVYHFFMPDFYNQLCEWAPHWFVADGPLKIPIYFTAVLLFAECSWFLIEQPILSWKKKITYSKQNN